MNTTHEPDKVPGAIPLSARGLGTRFPFCLRRFLFVCVVSVLFAWFLFCVRGFCFVCVVSILCAWFLFCLRGFLFVCVFSFFICVVSFLFACFLFCLQRVPCGPSYITHPYCARFVASRLGSNRFPMRLSSLEKRIIMYS